MDRSTRTYSILALVIVIWAFSWPVTKIGVSHLPALWMVTLRFLIAAVLLGVYLGCKGQLVWPKKQDMHLIVWVGAFQIYAFVVLLTLGVQYIGSGRSALIAYSTPLWVTPVAVLFFKEPFNRYRLVGLSTCLIGLYLLLMPALNGEHPEWLKGCLILVASAWSWSVGILVTRYSTWHRPPIQLLFWQLVWALGLAAVTATWCEPTFHWHWAVLLDGPVLYLSILGTLVAYWGALEVTRVLSPTTLTLAFLWVPILALLISSVWLKEAVSHLDCAAMGLMLAGLAVDVLRGKKA